MKCYLLFPRFMLSLRKRERVVQAMNTRFNNPYMEGGDAFVLLHGSRYYLYCTGDTEDSYDSYIAGKGWQTNRGPRDGIEVYTSDDLQKWTKLGYCLEKGRGAVGSQMFWSPEVYYHGGKFYMVYAADEHCCIAASDKPEGPFISESPEYLIESRAIDPHLFFDSDGKIYLYYSKLEGGNIIHVAQMQEDLSGIKEGSERLLMKAQEGTWENRRFRGWSVCEGPFVLKHRGLYYLSYSCNDVTDKDYAVGCAVSRSPLGPFARYGHDPVLIGKGRLRGFGHHSFFYDRDGALICVHHCHSTCGEKIAPRRICFQKAGFRENPEGGDDMLFIEQSE